MREFETWRMLMRKRGKKANTHRHRVTDRAKWKAFRRSGIKLNERVIQFSRLVLHLLVLKLRVRIIFSLFIFRWLLMLVECSIICRINAVAFYCIFHRETECFSFYFLLGKCCPLKYFLISLLLIFALFFFLHFLTDAVALHFRFIAVWAFFSLYSENLELKQQKPQIIFSSMGRSLFFGLEADSMEIK